MALSKDRIAANGVALAKLDDEVMYQIIKCFESLTVDQQRVLQKKVNSISSGIIYSNT